MNIIRWSNTVLRDQIYPKTLSGFIGFENPTLFNTLMISKMIIYFICLFNCIKEWGCLLTFKNDWHWNRQSQYIFFTVHLYTYKTGQKHILSIFQIDNVKYRSIFIACDLEMQDMLYFTFTLWETILSPPFVFALIYVT